LFSALDAPETFMRVKISRVELPEGSTVGFGYGKGTDGAEVAFCGDHRPMRDLVVALSEPTASIYAIVDDWQVCGGSSS
jgi:hypothetical protein